jgi:DNA invertase Pin-like site-specific DNA recombinase
MIVGYARVSTAEQNRDHQIDALLRAGVDRENIHVDYASGAKASRLDREQGMRPRHRRQLTGEHNRPTCRSL